MARSEDAEPRSGAPSWPSRRDALDKKVLVLGVAAAAASDDRVVAPELRVDLDAPANALEEGQDPAEGSERAPHEGPEQRRRGLDLLHRVCDQVVEPARLEHRRVGDLGQVAADPGQAVEDGP